MEAAALPVAVTWPLPADEPGTAETTAEPEDCDVRTVPGPVASASMGSSEDASTPGWALAAGGGTVHDEADAWAAADAEKTHEVPPLSVVVVSSMVTSVAGGAGEKVDDAVTVEDCAELEEARPVPHADKLPAEAS